MMFDAMSVLFEPYFLFLTLFVPNLSDNHSILHLVAAGRKVPSKCRDMKWVYFLAAPRRRPRPATVFFGPLQVREFVRVRCPREGKFRR